MCRPLKATLYAVVDLRRTLSQVRPFFGVFEKSMLVGLFGSPHNTSRGACSIETSVWLVAFVRLAELTVDGRAKFCFDQQLPTINNAASCKISPSTFLGD